MATAVSGMAASIRAAIESETFDLAGHSAANIEHTMTDAFSQALPLKDMIRITLIVGGGKLSRQKYDEKAMQSVTSALRKLDFQEDRGASCVKECAGTFKTQHDTGKNVFTVVVFPRLVLDEDDRGAGGDSSGEQAQQYAMSIPLREGTPEHMVLLASEETFQKMVPSMCPSWSEKKSCSEVLKAALDTVEQLDAKLMTGTPLTDEEQEFYDAVGGSATVAAKSELIKKNMQQQVETGSITSMERDKLLHQVTDRIEAINHEIDAASLKSQEKKVAKLNVQKQKAETRKKMLQDKTPQPPHKLKHDAQIMKLKKQLHPILKLEQSSKGRLLTMKETKEIAAKDEILDQIEELELLSRGPFEDDDAFETRLETSRKKKVTAPSTSKSASGGAGKKAGAGSRPMNTNWYTPGGLTAKQAALGKKATAKKPKPKSGGGVFAAMMMDSDSD